MKKHLIICLFILTMFFISSINVVHAKTVFSTNNMSFMNNKLLPNITDDNMSSNCKDFAPTIRIGGYILLVAKIVLPLIIIIKTSLNMFSVVMNGESKEFKKQSKKMMNALIAAVIVFFIPTLVNVIFGFITSYSDSITDDSKICSSCIFEPFSSECTDHIKK